MALKPDEVFVRDCLIKYFGADVTAAQEGEDPPDIYLTIKDRKVAVEITRLSPVSFDQDGSAQNRNTQDYFGINLCDELDSKLKAIVPPGINVILTLYVPVKNTRKYKKQLFEYLKSNLESGVTVGVRKEVEFSESKVRFSFVPHRSHSQKKIVGLIVNNNSNADILSNAEVILAGRILDKVKKCNSIQHQGPKWLALFNDYWLADYETYNQALNNISIKHDFESVFVISDTGQVNRIYYK